MLHEQLWAPWRLAYIKPDATPEPTPVYEYDDAPGADADCFICRAAGARKADGSAPVQGQGVDALECTAASRPRAPAGWPGR